MQKEKPTCPDCGSKYIVARVSDKTTYCRKCGWDSRPKKEE